jgi:hypothetical protein
MKIQLGGYCSCANPRYAAEHNAILYEPIGFTLWWIPEICRTGRLSRFFYKPQGKRSLWKS